MISFATILPDEEESDVPGIDFDMNLFGLMHHDGENYNADKSTENTKALKAGNKSLNDKLENKYLDFKHLISEVENVKNIKNTLSVVLKASKVDLKEENKEENRTGLFVCKIK